MSIIDQLYEFQLDILYKYRDKKSFGLFLDMGLGKTPLSLAFAEYHKCTKLLIITLNNKATESSKIEGSWLYWALRSEIKYDFLNKKSKSNEFKENSDQLLIINYESLFKHKKSLKKKFSLSDPINNFINTCKNNNICIIVDESHKMKDLSSLQTKSILKIKTMLELKNQVYCYLLTGTPFTSDYLDLYPQLKFLGYGESKTSFVDNFCIRGNLPGLSGWQQPIVGYKNLDKLYEIVHKFAITIKSDELKNKLPGQIFVYHSTPISRQFKLFCNKEAKGIDIMEENSNRENPEILDELYNTKNKVKNPYYRNINYPSTLWWAEDMGSFWLRMRQLSIGFQGNAEEYKWFDYSRLEEFENFIKDHPNNYVIFYNYVPELLALYDICDKLGYNIDVYCGEIKSTYFYEKYASLSEGEKMSSNKNVILSNFASGSTGKNWQAYNNCILFSIPLYKDYEQGIKRIHRTGQTKTTFYHCFYQNNWLDKSMWESLKESSNYSIDLFKHDLNNKCDDDE